MVVFRPFQGEVLHGSIRSSNPEGIVIDVEFFHDIFVPWRNLPPNCSFDQHERTWIWKTEGNELFFDKGEPVLFRVEQEEWFDQKPSVQQKDAQGQLVNQQRTAYGITVRTHRCQSKKSR
jgi:DNA-directed RNA polymerase III subunit RPC8